MMPEHGILGGGAIGTNVVFGDSSGFNRKRSIEAIEDEWSPSVQGQDGREMKRMKAER